jgi:hypothetical protein
MKCITLETWAGRLYHPVEVVGETPKKARVRILTPGGVMLPGRRYARFNDVVLVPKHALSELPADAHRDDEVFARREDHR